MGSSPCVSSDVTGVHLTSSPSSVWSTPIAKTLAACMPLSASHRGPTTTKGKPSLTCSSGVPSHAVKPSTPEAVSAALTEILREDMNVDTGRVTPASRLIDDVGLDSVAFAVGMVAIEDKLGVALSEEDLLSCDTVGDLEAAILAKVPAAQANS